MRKFTDNPSLLSENVLIVNYIFFLLKSPPKNHSNIVGIKLIFTKKIAFENVSVCIQYNVL